MERWPTRELPTEHRGERVQAQPARTHLPWDPRPPSRASATTIAYRWGFAGPSRLSRLFKERFGLAPRDLRAGTTRREG